MLSLSMRTTSPSPFAHATNVAGAPAAAAATAHAAETQGAFEASLALTLYDANGNVRVVEGERASLRPAALNDGVAAVIDVQDVSGRDFAVSVRDDGSFVAATRAGGPVLYDSRDGTSRGSQDVEAIARRARALVGLALAGGSSSKLRDGASGDLLAQAADGPQPDNGIVTVTITDAHGVSRYSGSAAGPVYAMRSLSDGTLETVTASSGIVTDAVRAANGSGTTMVDGAALGGMEIALTRTASGTEEIAMRNSGGLASDAAGTGGAGGVDAFGDTLAIGRGENGATRIALTDVAGNTFTFSGNTVGSSGSIGVDLGVGGATGTQNAVLAAQTAASTTTGSSMTESASLAAAATSAARSGRLAVEIDADVTSITNTKEGKKTTVALATLDLHAVASGTLDVAGSSDGGLENGYVLDGTRRTAGTTSRRVEGAASLDRSAGESLLDVHASQADTDVRSVDPNAASQTTEDGAALSMHGFGHGQSAFLNDSVSVRR